MAIDAKELGHESRATTQKYLEPSKETEKQLEAMKLPFLGGERGWAIIGYKTDITGEEHAGSFESV